MKNVRLKLEDDLHRRVRTVAVSTGRTLEQALVEGARLFAESGERDLRTMALAMSHFDNALVDADILNREGDTEE